MCSPPDVLRGLARVLQRHKALRFACTLRRSPGAWRLTWRGKAPRCACAVRRSSRGGLRRGRATRPRAEDRRSRNDGRAACDRRDDARVARGRRKQCPQAQVRRAVEDRQSDPSLTKHATSSTRTRPAAHVPRRSHARVSRFACGVLCGKRTSVSEVLGSASSMGAKQEVTRCKTQADRSPLGAQSEGTRHWKGKGAAARLGLVEAPGATRNRTQVKRR